jgi:hypothetical protein
MRELLKLWVKPDSRIAMAGEIQYWWNYFSKVNVNIIVKRFVSISIRFCWALLPHLVGHLYVCGQILRYRIATNTQLSGHGSP